MSKNTLLRVMSLCLGILLCLTSIPSSFAQEVNGNIEANETVIHEINPSENYLYLEQGESSSFTVSFKNNDIKLLK